ncbi:MAG: hypothetical protein M0C28_17520 [Candidatus Moduliflexus flocculans]|nr:hypothetical protein [Candidatus Moduliflexus flocculans]
MFRACRHPRSPLPPAGPPHRAPRARRGAEALAAPVGRAPLSPWGSDGRRGALVRRHRGRGVGRAPRLGGRGPEVPGAGRLDRLGPAPAVAPAPVRRE